MSPRNPVTILVAEDDPDDRTLAQDAFDESGANGRLVFVDDGVELLSYLRREAPYADAVRFPSPGLVLLDLNMPRKDGREALAEIKADPALRHIPVVVMSTSRSVDDVEGSYRAGANSFITKPSRFDGLVAMLRALGDYWLGTVDLPGGAERGG